MSWLTALIAALRTPPAITAIPASVETDLRKPFAATAQTQPALLLLSSDMRRRSLSADAMIRSRGMSVCNRNRKAAAIYIAKNTSLIPHKAR